MRYLEWMYFWEVVISLFLIVAVSLIRYAILRSLGRSSSIPSDVRRRILVNTRTVLLLALLFGLIAIWAQEIRDLALGIAAVAVAIAIGLKELILCLSGTFVKAVSRAFSIGDRIEVNGVRGDVIDQNFLTTTILEVSAGNMSNQYTGRAITLPNGIFTGTQVVNETFTDEFVLHLFTVPIAANQDWKLAEQILLKAAQEECAPHLARAHKHMHDLGQRLGLDMPTVDPRISIYIPEPSKIHLVVRVAVPARMRGRTEQAIIRQFLDEFRAEEEIQKGVAGRAEVA